MEDSTLAIIGCQVLEDEMAHIISHDPDVKNVLVIDSTVEHTLATKIKRLSPDKHVHLRDEGFDLNRFDGHEGMTVLVWSKPLHLHQSPELLREEILRAIQKVEPFVQSILLFYGQCGNAFMNMELFSQKVNVPLTILRDKDGSLVDDCYGTVLGGRENYRLFLVDQDGPAYVLNSMWAANWRHFMQEVQMLHDPYDIKEVREIFKYMDYRKVVGLNTGLVEDPIFEMQLEEFGEIFGLPQENRKCTLCIVEDSYREAKRRLRPSMEPADNALPKTGNLPQPEWSSGA